MCDIFSVMLTCLEATPGSASVCTLPHEQLVLQYVRLVYRPKRRDVLSVLYPIIARLQAPPGGTVYLHPTVFRKRVFVERCSCVNPFTSRPPVLGPICAPTKHELL